MLAEMYKRREKLGYVFLVFILLTSVGWLIVQTPKTEREWWEMLFLLFPIGLVISIIFINRSHYHGVKDVEIPNSEKRFWELKDVVIKRDAAIIPRLLLFEKSGEFVGSVQIAKVAWWMVPLLLRGTSLLALFPIKYEFVTHDGKTQLSFQKKGWLRQVKLTIFNSENHKLGSYIQEELKSLISIKGMLYNESEEPILAIKASGFSGSFSWDDQQGRQWAYFYNGIFPHEYTHLFKDAHNDIVKLSNDISSEDKTRLLAVIGYLFFIHIKQ